MKTKVMRKNTIVARESKIKSFEKYMYLKSVLTDNTRGTKWRL